MSLICVLTVHSCPGLTLYPHLYSLPSEAKNFLDKELCKTRTGIKKKPIGGNNDRCQLTSQRKTSKFFVSIAPLVNSLYMYLPRRGLSCLTLREVQSPEKLPGLVVEVENFELDWDQNPF